MRGNQIIMTEKGVQTFLDQMTEFVSSDFQAKFEVKVDKNSEPLPDGSDILLSAYMMGAGAVINFLKSKNYIVVLKK